MPNMLADMSQQSLSIQLLYSCTGLPSHLLSRDTKEL
jgi:hypothetical protein